MNLGPVWKDYFTHWPKNLPTTGVIVTSYDEQIQFVGFMTGETLLMMERRAPDTTGARKVLIPYDNIVALKLIDVVNESVFVAMGFKPSPGAAK